MTESNCLGDMHDATFLVVSNTEEFLLENNCKLVPSCAINSTNNNEEEIIAEINVHDSNTEEIITPNRKSVRKHIPQIKTWKSHVRKIKYQAGQEHINTRGKLALQKEIKNTKDCEKTCKFKCGLNLSKSERELIFQNYYELNKDGKHNYIAKTTARTLKKRTTVRNERGNESRRQFSFLYYFDVRSERLQVCKAFYLGTLSISQKPIYTVHAKKNPFTRNPPTADTSKKVSKKISDEDNDAVMAHIQSFPCVESHYARCRTEKKYLDRNLNVSKMYDLYKEKSEADNKCFVKESFYRHIFMTKFNLDFHIPKTDRCGKCELVKDKPDNEYSDEHKLHVELKKSMRSAKEVDKDGDIPIICFDLENVITCPRTEIGEAFYLSKLNVYNLTAHGRTEYTSGRSGNDIASAFYKILTRIFEEHNYRNVITWSDSCVPQNKNSHMAYAIKLFLKSHPDIDSITMKYSLPGHSGIQEVDHAHSEIEKVLRKNEFFSPIGLLRVMKNINRKRPYQLIQLHPNDFKNFAECTKIFNYKAIPFTKVKMLKFGQPLHIMYYSLNYNINDYVEVNIRPVDKSMRKVLGHTSYQLKEPHIYSKTAVISELKIKHLQSMFQYMTENDIVYYKTILKIGFPQTECISGNPHTEKTAVNRKNNK